MATVDKALDTAGLQRLCSRIQAVFGNLQAQINSLKNDSGFVPLTRKINNKELSEDINLTAGDVNAVPTSRAINGKVLSGDINLSAEDVGAASLSATTRQTFAGNIRMPRLQVATPEGNAKMVDFIDSDTNLVSGQMYVSTGSRQIVFQTIDDSNTYYHKYYLPAPGTMTAGQSHRILTSNSLLNIGSQNYGTTLPSTGVEGQIYFKKVT